MPLIPVAIPIRGRVLRFPLNHLLASGRSLPSRTLSNEQGASQRCQRFLGKESASYVGLVSEGEVGKIHCAESAGNCRVRFGLAVAIGKGGRNIAPASALDHVFGYAAGIDAGSGIALIGPITAASELHDKKSLDLVCSVNGYKEQYANDFCEVMRSIAAEIAQLSEERELESGDLIFTPAAEQWKKAGIGDKLLMYVDGLGYLHAKVA